MKKQVIYLITEGDPYSPTQVEEVTRLFQRYDIHIIPNVIFNDLEEIKTILQSSSDDQTIILAALHIEQSIKLKQTQIQNSPLAMAFEECRVRSYSLENEDLIAKDYDYATDGYLTDILQISTNKNKIDQNFILKNTLLRYSDLENHNMKNTSQVLAVSKFICNEIHYDEPINLNFHPQEQNGSVDFRNDPANFLKDNIYFNNSYAIQYGLTNLFHTVINKGIFFKSAKNRREKNYWYPPLNGGLPLVPKRDVIHEITYMAHDFSHFLIPDLLFTGIHTQQIQQTYIAHRMMTEAFTLVLADMVFVDSLNKSSFEYDYSKRKIYPLFAEFEIDLTNDSQFLKNLKLMLKASVNYCLRGDDRDFYTLSSKYRDRSKNLDNFKEKYMKFFCEDFKWTKNNYKSFQNRTEEIKKWWHFVSPLRQWTQVETIEEFINQMPQESDDLIENIFEVLYTRVSSILTKTPIPLEPFAKRQKKAFFKYMMGQLLLLIRYEHVVRESKAFQKIIMNYLMDIKGEISIANIDFCRNVLSEFVDILLDKNLINYDDALTFKDIFPIFEPYYVFYDEKLDYYKDLSIVAHDSIFVS